MVYLILLYFNIFSTIGQLYFIQKSGQKKKLSVKYAKKAADVSARIRFLKKDCTAGLICV